MLKILIVEDDELIAELERDYLEAITDPDETLIPYTSAALPTEGWRRLSVVSLSSILIPV